MEKKVNKGKTESVSMTVKGAIFSEQFWEQGWLVAFLSVVIFPLLPPGRCTEVYSVPQCMGQTSVLKRSFHCTRTPQLEVIAPAKLTLGTTSKGTVKFKKPLPVKMEKVVLTVEGDGL